MDSKDYIELDTTRASCGTIKAWISTSKADPCWDAFLASTPRGQFEQTSMWAQVKILSGWYPLRVLITQGKSILGGFQILIRSKSYTGKIGLIMKGPVVASDDQLIIKYVISTLIKVAKTEKISAIIIQPPDKHKALSNIMRNSGFSLNYIDNIIKTAAVIIDLSKEESDLLKRMKRNKKKNINTGLKMGVKIREGSKNDLSTFYNFMLETCKRQGVRPNPSNEKYFIKMWDLFSKSGNIKLFISEYSSEDVSANIIVPFGNTLNLWKFGWSGKYGNFHPNELLYWEIIKWAKGHGYRYADLGPIDARLANSIFQAKSTDSELLKSSSGFKLGFGGEVTSLADACVYIYNPFLLWAYNIFMPFINSLPWLRSRILFNS